MFICTFIEDFCQKSSKLLVWDDCAVELDWTESVDDISEDYVSDARNVDIYIQL